MMRRFFAWISAFWGEWFRLVRKGFSQASYRRSTRRWLAFLAVIPALGLLAGGVILVRFFGSLPSLETLERIEPNLITKVYDKDTNLVHEFYTQRRIWTPSDRIPRAQKYAV